MSNYYAMCQTCAAHMLTIPSLHMLQTPHTQPSLPSTQPPSLPLLLWCPASSAAAAPLPAPPFPAAAPPASTNPLRLCHHLVLLCLPLLLRRQGV